MKAAHLLSRLIFGGFFFYNGVHHFIDRKKMSQYAAAKKVPLADAAVLASGVALIASGASILTGVRPKLGAAGVVGFLAGVSPMMHDFWKQQDAAQRQNEMIHFSKNMALLGGALALMALEEPWPLSIPVLQPERGDDWLDSGSVPLAA